MHGHRIADILMELVLQVILRIYNVFIPMLVENAFRKKVRRGLALYHKRKSRKCKKARVCISYALFNNKHQSMKTPYLLCVLF